MVATTASAVLPARIDVTADANGPVPETAKWAPIARAATAMPMARNTDPWTCELAESFSPSGLHRSQRPTSNGTGAPHRAHGWVAPVAGEVPGAAGAGATGATGSDIGRMVPWTPRRHRRCDVPCDPWHRGGLRTEGMTMTIFQVTGGSFEIGPAEITPTQLHVRRLSAKTGSVRTTIPLPSVAAVDVPGTGAVDPSSAVVSGAIVGGLTLGVTGAISGAVVADSGAKSVSYIVRLKDRRWIMVQSNRTILRQFQQAAAAR